MNYTELVKLYDFTGRTFVVTGGTGVLCGAMARALVGCGANVAILARNREKGQAVLPTMLGPGKAIIRQAEQDWNALVPGSSVSARPQHLQTWLALV